MMYPDKGWKRAVYNRLTSQKFIVIYVLSGKMERYSNVLKF
jgi:hypothetical protein